MPIIRVKKQFIYSRPKLQDEKLAVEQVFKPGEHEISEAMADHPWIRDHFADGCIESPAEAAARAEAAKVAAEKAEEEAKQVQALADASFARLQVNAENNAGTPEEIERELNTPVSKLRRAGGK